MNPSEAWYRSPEWDERDFRARLARARPHNQIQYRRIKAHALLASAQPDKRAAARELLREIIEARETPEFEKVMALSMLGEHALRLGDLDDAEARLRSALDLLEGGASGGSGLEATWLAEVLLARGGRSRLEEAKALLDHSATSPPLLLSSQFDLCLIAVKVTLALGDNDEARTWARTALDLASATHSGLANHPTLGLVEADQQVRDWLVAIAADDEDGTQGTRSQDLPSTYSRKSA